MAESYPNSNPFQQDDHALDAGMGQQTHSSTMANGVTDGLEHAEHEATEGLHKMRDTAERDGKRVKSGFAQASNYVKSMDASDMWGDVKELARRNPGASMVTMAVIGFAIGRTTSRSSR